MRRTTMIAAVLALSLVPALQAQTWGGRGQDRRGYPYPNSGQLDRVAALVSELENTATYIHRQFERNNRRPDRAEARVIADLHELNERASRLRSQLTGYGDGYRNGYGNRQDRRYGTDAFVRVEEAFFDLSDSLRYIRPRGYVDQGMDRIYDLMNQLGRYYGRRDDYGRGYDGRDRYGHDRDDGRGRNGGYDRDGDEDHGYRPPQN